MKKSRFIVFFIFMIAAATTTWLLALKTEAKRTYCGKCTGSAYCSACKTCNYCAYCNSGGSCGVCARPSHRTTTTAPKPTYTTPTPKPSKTTDTNNTTGTDYTVTAQTLNIRSAPSTAATVLLTLKTGTHVTVLNFTNEQWVKVKYGNVTGYVVRIYLKQTF